MRYWETLHTGCKHFLQFIARFLLFLHTNILDKFWGQKLNLIKIINEAKDFYSLKV